MLVMQCWNRNQVYSSITLMLVTLCWCQPKSDRCMEITYMHIHTTHSCTHVCNTHMYVHTQTCVHTHMHTHAQTHTTHWPISLANLVSPRAAFRTAQHGIPFPVTLSCCCSHAASISLLHASMTPCCSTPILSSVE